MRGYEVVTSDDRAVGRVVDVREGYLIVESGRLRTSRRPLPREFVHPVDETAKAFVTIPRRVLRGAPKVKRNGFFDRDEAARHFGLVVSYPWPSTEGLAESLPHQPAWGADTEPIAARELPPEHRRAEIRKHLRPGYPEQHRHAQAALFGERRLERRRARKGEGD